MNNQTKTRILVLGAGYGGLLSTLRLVGRLKRQRVEITLVNGMDTFIPRIQLHQIATHQQVKTRPLAQILRGKNVTFVQGWVTAIDPAANQVAISTAAGQTQIGYDYLVYALGSHTDTRSIPGVAEYAHTLDAYGDRSVDSLKTVLPDVAQRCGHLVIIGGGPTGIEAATEIKDVYPDLRVSVYTAQQYGLLPGKERLQPTLKKGTEKRGVLIYEYTPVERVDPDTIVLADGKRVPYDVCLWAGGFKAHSIAGDAGLKVNGRGQILVDPTLRSLSHPNIYALGDSAHPVEEPGAIPRMGVYFAVVTGLHVANNLSAMLKNKPQKPLSFGYMGQGVGLGLKNAVGFYSFPDDHPKFPFVFTGRAGFYMRNFFVWFLNSLIPLEAAFPGTFYWFGRRLYKKQQREMIRTPKGHQTA